MSRPPQFLVGGEWLRFEGPEGESPIEEAQRIAHLREAKAREAEQFRCPMCGLPGALKDGGDRYHGPGLCDQRRPTPACVCKAGDGTVTCPFEDQCYSEYLDRHQRGGAA